MPLRRTQAQCCNSGSRGSLGAPWVFFSQKLSAAEARYSAFNRELLAVYSGILHFRHLLEGCSFTIFTDDLPLLGALTCVSEPRLDRQRRQLSFKAEFATELRHISGQSNVVADSSGCAGRRQPSPKRPAGWLDCPGRRRGAATSPWDLYYCFSGCHHRPSGEAPPAAVGLTGPGWGPASLP
jgi:hypothetical protein